MIAHIIYPRYGIRFVERRLPPRL